MSSKIDPHCQQGSPSWTSQGEFNRITELQKELEYRGSFVASATRCRGLGWRLAAVDTRELADLEVNFSDAPEAWLQNLGLLGPLKGRVGLGVHTGAASRLLVLEVHAGAGVAALDQYGDWHSPCRAWVNGREQHYYALLPGSSEVSTCFLTTSQVMVYGEDGLAPVPPSMDTQTRDTWRWLGPPWEYPPPKPPQPIWNFLKDHMFLSSAPYPEPDVPSWDEVYRLINPHEQVLKAILAPILSPEEYYHNLLQAALETGFRDRAFLLGLLWHAPRGDARQKPERWAHFEGLVNLIPPASLGNGESLEVTGGKELAPGNNDLEKRSRYEAILGELKRLSHKTAELEGLLTKWGQELAPGQDTAPPFQKASLQDLVGQSDTSPPEECREVENLLTIFEGRLHQGFKAKAPTTQQAAPPVDQAGDEIRLSYTELPPKGSVDQQPEVIEATMRACLKRYPDLASDPLKVQMIQYCFRNYVNIDPEMVDLPLQERMERASQMAREFLGIRGSS